jgi:hypothetical protein
MIPLVQSSRSWTERKIAMPGKKMPMMPPYKKGGAVFKPCAKCPSPAKCKAAGKCAMKK